MNALGSRQTHIQFRRHRDQRKRTPSHTHTCTCVHTQRYQCSHKHVHTVHAHALKHTTIPSRIQGMKQCSYSSYTNITKYISVSLVTSDKHLTSTDIKKTKTTLTVHLCVRFTTTDDESVAGHPHKLLTVP